MSRLIAIDNVRAKVIETQAACYVAGAATANTPDLLPIT
jgi:hypothetical protein